MHKNISDKLKLSLFILIGMFNQTSVFAQTGDDTNFSPFFDFLARSLNLIAGLAGTVFLIMIFVAAFKYAMALGDPKGLQGARDTLTLALTGLIVVLGAGTILRIIIGMFGIDSSILNPIDSLKVAIGNLINSINSCNAGTIGCF